MQEINKLLEERLKQYVSDAHGKQELVVKKNITTEFQDYGMRLAHRLDDIKHKSMYIRYAKTIPRAILEDAAAFATDYPKAQNKGKIFMWKLTELMREYREKHPEYKAGSRNRRRTKKRAKVNDTGTKSDQITII